MQIYTLIRTNRRTLSLQISKEWFLIARAPLKLSQEKIEQFIELKSQWIQKMQEKVLSQNKYEDEPNVMHYFGKKYTINFSSTCEKMGIQESTWTFTLPYKYKEFQDEKITYWYKMRAKEYLSQETYRLATLYNFRYKNIKVTSAKTRWGSCSALNAINYSYRLIKQSKEAIEYVIIHELVHTKIKNHWVHFWKMVESILPDYKKREWILKSSGSPSWNF